MSKKIDASSPNLWEAWYEIGGETQVESILILAPSIIVATAKAGIFAKHQNRKARIEKIEFAGIIDVF